MQNWSPEPFAAVEGGDQAGQDGDWRGEPLASDSISERLFRKDNWGTGTGALKDLLTQVEWQELHEQIETEVAETYRQQLEESQADQRQANEAWLARLAEEIQTATTRKLQDFARNTGELAIAIAERIVRRSVQLDREILSRAIEVLFMKAEVENGLELRVHPEDAEFLSSNDELLQKLNIEKITPDRRIERGGCLAKAGDQMWDASLRGQLDALTELVDEIMSSENVPEENVDGEPDSSLA